MKRTFFAVSLSVLVVFPQAGCGRAGTSTPSGSSSVAGGSAGGSGVGTAATGDPPATLGSGGAPATAPAGVAKLSWTPSVGAAGFNVYYGTLSGSYSHTINVGMVPSYSVDGLVPGTYYFVVTAYDSLGNESAYSSEVSKTII